jgi:hypothetical protein
MLKSKQQVCISLLRNLVEAFLKTMVLMKEVGG